MGGIHYWGETAEEEYYREKGIRGSSSYFREAKSQVGVLTRQWLPERESPRALIFMLHGYGNDTGWTFQATPIFLAQHGFACYGLDLPGHGRSEGLRAFVPDVGLVAQLCLAYFNSFIDSHPSDLPRFLFGESMGGAICLLLHFLAPLAFSGAVLVAPMCRISDSLRPPRLVAALLESLARVFPTLAVVPAGDLVVKSVKVAEKKRVAVRNPLRYVGRPRLGTVVELLRVTDSIARRLGDVSFPFLVLHGSDDSVTDPAVSLELHAKAASVDKEIFLYDGMWHSLLFGETDENVARVRADILAWLTRRS